jgi:hypothetical protein
MVLLWFTHILACFYPGLPIISASATRKGHHHQGLRLGYLRRGLGMWKTGETHSEDDVSMVIGE